MCTASAVAASQFYKMIAAFGFPTLVSTTYWQVFWRRLHRPLPLSTIDNLADQLKAVYQLLNFKTIKASPLLAGLACIAWLIPLAVVFPPTALRVVSQDSYGHELVRFHVPNYTESSRFVASYGHAGTMKRNGMGTMSTVKGD